MALATKPLRIFALDHAPVRLIAEIEQRSPADVVHAALVQYLQMHKDELADVFTATQRAIAAGDLETLGQIAASSAQAQADAAMARLEALE
ncbi:MAG TPA: hypothetical protein VIL53_07145 [Solirubrobacterales bacterium]|jgi:uncharacterized protein involved in propanediol utilization